MNHSKFIYMAVLAFGPQVCSAQQLALNTPPDAPAASTSATTDAEAVVGASSTTAAAAKDQSLTARWLDLDTLSHSERYRNAFQVGGYHNFENAQERSVVAGHIKLDAEDRYQIGFRASSGRYFNWAYSNYTGEGFIPRVTSAGSDTFLTAEQGLEVAYAKNVDPAGQQVLQYGIQSNGWEFYMRELYLSATPVKPITVEFGSFGIDKGYSTEITSFDEDGYLTGERVRLHDAKHLFFDEVSFTSAYFGDIDKVNLFARGDGYKSSNYRQVVAKKELNKRFAFSGEYTWQTGLDTLREAFVVKTPETKVVDGVRFEAYERVNSLTFAGAETSAMGPIPSLTVKGASGFAVTVDKKWGRMSGDFGFATVDSDYSVYANSRFIHSVAFSLNGDTYGLGNRPFVHAAYKLAPGVTAFGFYTHEVGSTRVPTLNQQGLNAGVTFDLKAMANMEKKVF